MNTVPGSNGMQLAAASECGCQGCCIFAGEVLAAPCVTTVAGPHSRLHVHVHDAMLLTSMLQWGFPSACGKYLSSHCARKTLSAEYINPLAQ